jgi:hypothetical protein
LREKDGVLMRPVAVARAVNARLAGVKVTAHATAVGAMVSQAADEMVYATAVTMTAAAALGEGVIGEAGAAQGKSCGRGPDYMQNESFHDDRLSVGLKQALGRSKSRVPEALVTATWGMPGTRACAAVSGAALRGSGRPPYVESVVNWLTVLLSRGCQLFLICPR